MNRTNRYLVVITLPPGNYLTERKVTYQMGISYRNCPVVMVKRLTLNETTAKLMLNTAANEFSKGNIDLRTLNALTFDSVQLSKKIAEAKKICERIENLLNGGEKN